MRNRIIQLIGEAAARDNSIVFLTGDLGFSVVEPLQETMGERFVNMGVAEANMVSVASSLSASGFKVFTYTIAPFMTARCLEQIRNDACYQRRPIKLIGVGAGYSYGSLGPSHHALEDAHILDALPQMIIGNPANVWELERFFALMLNTRDTVYFRISRESGTPRPIPNFDLATSAFVLREGDDVNFVVSGVIVDEAWLAAQQLAEFGISCRLISVPVLKPFPEKHLATLLANAPVLAIFEGYAGNPLSVGVMRVMLKGGMARPFAELSVRDSATRVGNTEFLRTQAGLNADSIAAAAKQLLSGEPAN